MKRLILIIRKKELELKQNENNNELKINDQDNIITKKIEESFKKYLLEQLFVPAERVRLVSNSAE